jgi:excisionase family DNA binding protein
MSKDEIFAALAMTTDRRLLDKVARVLRQEDEALNTKGDTETRLLTQSDAAKRLGISTTTIWRLIKEGSLKVVSVRGKQRVRLDSLLAYVWV